MIGAKATSISGSHERGMLVIDSGVRWRLVEERLNLCLGSTVIQVLLNLTVLPRGSYLSLGGSCEFVRLALMRAAFPTP